MSPTPERLPAGRAPQQSEDRFRLLVEGVKDYAIFMLDANGFVASWNSGAECIKGYSADEIIGKHFSLFYPPETLASGLPAHELEVAKEVGSFEDEGWRVRKDGSLFWANVVITALRDPRGDLLGFSKVTRDLTQRRAHEEALRQSEERFRLLVEGVKDYAIFMLDANGFVASWNSGAERINGYSADEIIGKHFSLFYPAEARDSGWPEHELQMAAERGSFIDEGWRLRKDGTRIWAHVTIAALRDSEGRLLGYAKLTRDLTDRKNAEVLKVAGQERDEILEAERSARMAAQRATRIKDEFLATRTLLTPRPSIRMQPTYRAAASCTAQVRSATMKTETTARADLDNAVLIEAAVGDGQACDVAQALGVARRPSAPRMNPIVGMARAVYKGDPL